MGYPGRSLARKGGQYCGSGGLGASCRQGRVSRGFLGGDWVEEVVVSETPTFRGVGGDKLVCSYLGAYLAWFIISVGN